jgi:hypothetical protein
LIVNKDPENKETTKPPIIAVINPMIGGKSLAFAMPKLRGKAIKKTKKPEETSFVKCSRNPLNPSWGFTIFLLFCMGYPKTQSKEPLKRQFIYGIIEAQRYS